MRAQIVDEIFRQSVQKFAAILCVLTIFFVRFWRKRYQQDVYVRIIQWLHKEVFKMHYQLEALFDEWKREIRADEALKGRPFIKDGIIDGKVFIEQKVKTLFISNESNIDGHFDLDVEYDIRTDFKDYAETGYDCWKGKLRERVSCLYQVIANDYSIPPCKYAKSFAFINLNKTGGGRQIDNRIQYFCKQYAKYIREEIGIIHPDLIVWLGCNTFDNAFIREDCLGIKKNGKVFCFGKVPVIRMCHTSYSRIQGERLNVFDNAIVDRMAYRLNMEIKALERSTN